MENERKALPQRGYSSLLNYFFPVRITERLHLAFLADQEEVKRKEAKTIPFRLSHLFILSTHSYLVLNRDVSPLKKAV